MIFHKKRRSRTRRLPNLTKLDVAKITPFFELATIMDKKIAKKRNRYCSDEKINRQIRRDTILSDEAEEFISTVVWGIDLLL